MLQCPPEDTAICDINEIPPFTSWAAFLAAGGSATTDSLGVDTTTFTLLREESDFMSCPETVTRTYFIQDICGNTGTCQQLIIVHDTIPPTLVCPSDTLVQCATDLPAPLTNLSEFMNAGGMVSDNCSGSDECPILALGFLAVLMNVLV